MENSARYFSSIAQCYWTRRLLVNNTFLQLLLVQEFFHQSRFYLNNVLFINSASVSVTVLASIQSLANKDLFPPIQEIIVSPIDSISNIMYINPGSTLQNIISSI